MAQYQNLGIRWFSRKTTINLNHPFEVNRINRSMESSIESPTKESAKKNIKLLNLPISEVMLMFKLFGKFYIHFLIWR